jgi:metal-sulfur cluster biosynthetic enzyme
MVAEDNISEVESLLSEIPDPEIPVITIKELGILRRVE